MPPRINIRRPTEAARQPLGLIARVTQTRCKSGQFMNPKLAKQLSSYQSIKVLHSRAHSGSNEISIRSQDNVFALLLAHDPYIGYKVGSKIHIKDGGWQRIAKLVQEKSQIDILKADIGDLKNQDRIEAARLRNDEKQASKPPTSGFLELRLLGDADLILKATGNQYSSASRKCSYIGAHITDVSNWHIDALIVVENFTCFYSLSLDELSTIDGLPKGVIALVYRGHQAHKTSLVYNALAQVNTQKYIFADYDLSGLLIAESLAKSIHATGAILPKDPSSSSKLASLNKTQSRTDQAGTKVTKKQLIPYFKHLNNHYLAITQEALMAHKIPLTLVNF